MSFRDKIMDMVIAHPKLVTFTIGFAVTFTVGTVLGMLDHNQVFAIRSLHQFTHQFTRSQ
jgi:hypothetical protein